MSTGNIAQPLALKPAAMLTPSPLWQLDFLRGDWLPELSAALAPRFDVNPRTLLPRGLLVEGAATNLATYSSNLSQWNLNGGATTNHATTAPDGSTAYSLALGTVWYSGIYRGVVGLATGAPLTMSGYFKYVTGDATVFFGSDGGLFGNGSQLAAITFNSQTGAVVSTEAGVTGYAVQDVGGGWYRVSVTGTLVTGTTANIVVYHGTDTAGESAAWGIQAEQGTLATSLMVTAAGTASRAADVMTLANLAAMGLNPAEGSLLVEAEFEGIDSAMNQPLLQLDDGASSNRLLLGQSGGHLAATISHAGGDVLAANVLTSPAAGVIYKMALGYKNASFSACANGGTVATAASGAVPAGLSTLRLGSDGSAFAQGWLRRITCYPQKLADGELKLLTA